MKTFIRKHMGTIYNKGLCDYFLCYNNERKHSELDKRTPSEVFLNSDAGIINHIDSKTLNHSNLQRGTL